MDRRAFVFLAASSGAALALAGCAGVVAPENAKPPEIELSNIRYLGGLFSQDVELELRLKNPNDFSLPLDALTYVLDVNGSRFIEGRSSESVTIPRLGDVLYPVKATTSVLDLLQQALNLNTSGLAYRISGIAYLGRFFPQGVPYQKEGRIGLLGGSGGSSGSGGSTGSGSGGGTRTLKPL